MRKGHSFGIRSFVAPIALTGLAFLVAALALRLLGVDISWLWIAVAIPVGMHAGVILLVLAGFLRWLTRGNTYAGVLEK